MSRAIQLGVLALVVSVIPTPLALQAAFISGTNLIVNATGSVPIATRSISLAFQMTRTEGTCYHGYADILSLILEGGACFCF